MTARTWIAIATLHVACVRNLPDSDGHDAREMMASTVKVEIRVKQSSGFTGMDGSGFVVATDGHRKLSLVMTAAHVALVNDQVAVGYAATVVVKTLDDRSCTAAQWVVDVEHDIVILLVDCVAGNPVTFATTLPPQGATVSFSGAPMGLHPRGVFWVTEGRYLGIYNDGDVAFSVPSHDGGSGSGIFYRGRVIGMFHRRDSIFEEATFGVSLEWLRQAMDTANSTWNSK